MQSDAFCRSQKPPTYNLLFNEKSIFIKLYEAISVDELFLKSKCSLSKI
jgi:hypothetical protein